MTDHKAAAEALMPYGTPEHLAEAQVHATLHLADVVEAMAGNVDIIQVSTFDGPQAPPADVGSSLDRALQDVHWERLKQISQGWTFEHDQKHGIRHLRSLIRGYLDGSSPHKTARENLVIVAALAVAGIELLDGNAVSDSKVEGV